MAKINFKQLYRRPVVFIGVMLLFDIQVEADHSFCPSACVCVFSDEPTNNHATCDFGNFSLNVTWGYIYIYDANLLWSSLTCQGTNYTCADMPRFDNELSNVILNITSCSSKVLSCLDDMYPRVQRIVDLNLHDMRNLNPIDNVGKLKPASNVRVISTDVAVEVELAIVNTFNDTFGMEIIGGTVKSSHNLIINGEREYKLYLHLSNNNINSLSDDYFKGLNLITLNIENSNIEHISAAMLRGLEELEFLILQGNKKLQSIEGEAITNKKILQEVHLDNNLLENIPNEMFTGLIYLREVEITNNLKAISLGPQAFANLRLRKLKIINSKLSILPEAIFENSLDLTQINFANNMIQTLPLKLFWTTLSLEEIILESNRIHTLPENIFSKLYVLKMIDLRNNHIIEINVFQVWSLTELRLDGNDITVLDMDMLPVPELLKLSVTFNKIQRVVQTIPHLRTIEQLDLSNNNISMFEDWLYSSNSTVKVNLSYNNINIVKESHLYIPEEKEIMEIDLRHNNISHIIRNKSVLNYSSVRQARLYLSNNPIECDCSVTKVLKDFYMNNNLADYKDIICANSKEHLSDTKLYQLCDTKETLMNVIGISAIGALFILIIIISMYSRRHKIWHSISNVFNRRKEKIAPYQLKLDALKTFDIFVSFAHQNDEFVGNVLLPKLEYDFGQTVCVHYRDWIVGDLITDQIIQSVENSKKTIIVLTKDFLLSDWSQLEFQAAHNFSKQEGTSKLIIIVLDEGIIRDQQLTPDLKSYIIMNKYFLWGDPDFWKKLKKVLPRQGKRSINLYKST